MNGLMHLLNFCFRLVDLPSRLKFLFLRKIGKYSAFSKTNRSDSDSTPYSNYVKKVLADEDLYVKFRRDYSYRLILEHVDFKLGLLYLDKLTDDTIGKFTNLPDLKKLSLVGSPRKFYYPKLGWISPTVIRYLFVHQEIVRIFGKTDFRKVGEIGVGFGGQCVVSSSLSEIKVYSAYDLPEVLSLTKRIVSSTGIAAVNFEAMKIDEVVPAAYELVISNYAFSELPSEIQIDYVEKVLSQSERGYLTMNSGRTNYSGRSNGKLSLKQILHLLPNCEILEEDPLTGPDNYILIWGHKEG